MANPESLGDLDNFSPQNGKELAGIVATFPEAFEKLARPKRTTTSDTSSS